MWIFRGGGPGRTVLLYRYKPTRTGEFAKEYLGRYHGYIQADGYKGYNRVGKDNDMIRVGCWAHARRYFADVVKISKKSVSVKEAMNYIAKIYLVEKEARIKGLAPEEIRDLGQEKAKPILDRFKIWLDEKVSQVPPSGKTGQALNYTLGFWNELIVYLKDGRIPVDNNLVANAIRPFVVGKKTGYSPAVQRTPVHVQLCTAC